MTKLDRFLTPIEQKKVEKNIPIRLRDYYEGLEHPRLYIVEEGSYTANKLELELELEKPLFFEIDLMKGFMNKGIAWSETWYVAHTYYKNIAYIIVDDDTVGDDPEDIIDYAIRFIKLDRFLTPNEQKEAEKNIPIRLRDYYEGLEHPRLYIVEEGSYTAKELEEAYQGPFFEIDVMTERKAWVDKNIAYIIVDDDTVGDDPEDIIDYMH